MHSIVKSLSENMQLIYRKAIDADANIEALHKAGKGKFNSIFTEKEGFTTQHKRFLPYAEEVARDIAKISESELDEMQTSLPDIVRKIELLLVTLDKFNSIVKEK